VKKMEKKDKSRCAVMSNLSAARKVVCWRKVMSLERDLCYRVAGQAGAIDDYALL